MEIKKTITINVTKKGDNIVCDDLDTLKLVIGTTAVGGNLHMYNITKNKNVYNVPMVAIRKRIDELEKRVEKYNKTLEIMKQIVK